MGWDIEDSNYCKIIEYTTLNLNCDPNNDECEK